MTYPYGMHNMPAVGGGLPGLPRRRSTKQDKEGLDLSAYRIMALQASSMALFDGFGNKIEEDVFPYTQPSEAIPSLDYGQRLCAIVAGESVTRLSRNLTIYDTKDLSIVSRVTITENVASNNIVRQIGIHAELGLVALSSLVDIRIFSLSDMIAANGADLSSLTPLYTFNSSNPLSGGNGAEFGCRWNPQGTLFVAFKHGLNGRIGIYKWPSLDNAYSYSWARSGGNFTQDGKGLHLCRGSSSSGNNGWPQLDEITYTAGGEYVSSQTVIQKPEVAMASGSSGFESVAAFSEEGQMALLNRNTLIDYAPELSPESLTKNLPITNFTSSTVRHGWSADGELIASSVSSQLYISLRDKRESRLGDNQYMNFSVVNIAPMTPRHIVIAKVA